MYCPDCPLRIKMFEIQHDNYVIGYCCNKCFISYKVSSGNDKFELEYILSLNDKRYKISYENYSLSRMRYCRISELDIDNNLIRHMSYYNQTVITDIIIHPFSPIKSNLEKLLKNNY